MPLPFHSFREIRKNLIKAMPYNKQKRDFILGYLEGQAEQRSGSSSWQISQRRLQDALKKLDVGRESTMPGWGQVKSEDVSKIKKQFQPPTQKPA